MIKRRELLKVTGALASSVFVLISTARVSQSSTVPSLKGSELDIVIRKWSKSSEYSTKYLKGYGALCGGSRDLSVIIDYVRDYSPRPMTGL